jgi:hypothetical protein
LGNFFAGSGKDEFNFDYKNRSKASKKRPHGDGSRVVQRHVVAACRPQTWTNAELEIVGADIKVNGSSRGSTQWLRELAKTRTWEHK